MKKVSSSSNKKDEILDPYKKTTNRESELGIQYYLRSLYPKVEVQNGMIYPLGKESTARNPTNFPAYKLNKQNFDLLMG